MFFDTPAFQALMNDYSKLTAMELFETCSDGAQQNKQAAILVLLSKTDSESLQYQDLLGRQHDNWLERTDVEFKNQLIKTAHQAMQTSSSNLEHKLTILSFLKHIENQTISIPQVLIDAFVNDPLYFPLPVLSAFMPQCHTDDIMQLLLTLQGKCEDGDFEVREKAFEAIAAVVPKLDLAQIPDNLFIYLQQQLLYGVYKIRKKALIAIAELAPKFAPAQITKLFIDLQRQLHAEDSMVRREALIIIAELVPKLTPAQIPNTLITDLQKQLQDGDYSVRAEALDAIAALIPKLDPAQIPAPITDLQTQLQDGDYSVRAGALRAIAALIPKLDPAQIPNTLITDLQKRLQDGCYDVRAGALRAIAALIPKLDPAQIPEALITDLQQRLQDENDECRKKAIEAIATLFPRAIFVQQEELMQALIQALEETNQRTGWFGFFATDESDMKQHILNAIEKIVSHASPEFVSPQLLQLVQMELKATDPETRESAWNVLIALTLHFPRQVNEYVEQCPMDAKDWASNVLGCLVSFCGRKETHTALITESATLFSSASKPSSIHNGIKKLDLTPEQIDDMKAWSNTFP